MLSGPRYIPDSLYTCLCQVYPLCSHLISYPSFLTSSLPREAPERQPEDRCQSQTTVARTRRPSPEPDDDQSNGQPANTTNDLINRSIELNQSFDIGLLPNQIKASYGGTPDDRSQRAPIESDSNQYNQLNQAEPSIGPTLPSN